MTTTATATQAQHSNYYYSYYTRLLQTQHGNRMPTNYTTRGVKNSKADAQSVVYSN